MRSWRQLLCRYRKQRCSRGGLTKINRWFFFSVGGATLLHLLAVFWWANLHGKETGWKLSSKATTNLGSCIKKHNEPCGVCIWATTVQCMWLTFNLFHHNWVRESNSNCSFYKSPSQFQDKQQRLSSVKVKILGRKKWLILKDFGTHVWKILCH